MTPEKPVAIITWVGQKPELPSLLLTSHMDVVPVYPVSKIYLSLLKLYLKLQLYLRNIGHMIHFRHTKMRVEIFMLEEPKI